MRPSSTLAALAIALAIAQARPLPACAAKAQPVGGTFIQQRTVVVQGKGQSGPMTLQDAIDYAQLHNPSVQQAYSQAVAAAATLAKARSVQLPLISGELQNTMTRQTSSGSLAQFGLSPNPNFSQNTAALLGSLDVFNMNDSLTARQAKNSLDAALENLRFVREQTIFSVETDYYTYIQAADFVNVSQADVGYNKALLAIAQANYHAGRVAGIDALKAQVQLASSNEKLLSAQADAEDARENLALAIGADQQTPFVIASLAPAAPTPSLNATALNATALTHRPEISSAQDAFNNAVLSDALVDAPNRPTVALQGQWGNQVSPTQRAAQEAECQAAPLVVPCPGTTHFYAVGVQSTWSLPFVDWGAVHASHQSAHAAIDYQRYALDNARRQALVDVDQAVRRLKVDRDNLATATANAQLAKQVAQISQVQYKVGAIGQIDATASEQAYLQAAKDLLAAQVAYVLGLEKLKLATGTLATTAI